MFPQCHQNQGTIRSCQNGVVNAGAAVIGNVTSAAIATMQNVALHGVASPHPSASASVWLPPVVLTPGQSTQPSAAVVATTPPVRKRAKRDQRGRARPALERAKERRRQEKLAKAALDGLAGAVRVEEGEQAEDEEAEVAEERSGSNPHGLPEVLAAKARFAWKVMFANAENPRLGSVIDRKRKYLNLKFDRRDGACTDFFQVTAVPERQGAVLVRGPTDGDGLIAAAVCVSAANVPPAVGPGRLERAIQAMHTALRDSLHPRPYLPHGALVDMQLAWVRAMLRHAPGERDDWLRGGCRNQTGWAQGGV